jgi:hypothetical protein
VTAPPAAVPGRIGLAGGGGSVSSLLLRPVAARALLVFAHGAGAGMSHATLETIAGGLCLRGIGTLRFNFPFMEAKRPRTDAQARAVAVIGDAVLAALALADCPPLFVGGHSFGGRMASHAALAPHPAVRGLVCCAFPLHAAGAPATQRAAHLAQVPLPMLFASGSRDALAQPSLLAGVVAGIGARAALHWLDDADHGYRARVRQRRDPRPVLDELCDVIAAFVDAQVAAS